MPIAEMAGEAIAYSIEGRGPPVLLLHSMGGGAWVWDSLTRRLAPHFTVIAFDAPGHGGSSYRQPFRVERMAEIGAELIGRAGTAPASVVGVSMGGHAALRLAERWPERVGRLVVANHSLGGTGRERELLDAFRARLAAHPLPEFAQAYAASRMKRVPDAAMVKRYADSVCAMAPGAFLDTFASILSQDHHERARRIACPALVIASDADVSSPLNAVRAVAQAIPGAALAVLEDSNHFAYLDQPERFNAAVLQHLGLAP